MGTATNLVLMATDPVSGKFCLGSRNPAAVLGGAHLFDLVASGRLGLVGEGGRARVITLDDTAAPDPEIEFAFGQVRGIKRHRSSDAVHALGHRALVNAYARLLTDTRVRRLDSRVLGVRVRRHQVLDVAGRESLRQAVRSALLHGSAVDPVTGPLVGVLSASDQLKLVVDRAELARAKAAAAGITTDDRASAAVRRASRATRPVTPFTTGTVIASSD